MTQASLRAQKLDFSPIRKLVPLALKAKSRGIKIYHLNIGQPDIESPKIFLDKVRSFKKKVVAYEQSGGNQALRQSLCRYYQKVGLRINDNDMVVTHGGSEALWMAFFILLNPGEECLTLEPFYTNYTAFSQTAGVKLKTVPTYLKDDFQLPPLKEIEKAVSRKTKAVIITNPSNPTGAVYPKEMLKELVDFCVKRKIFIITDETYREFIYDNQETVSLLSFKKAEQITVLADSLSKRYSLCGARLGVLVSKNKQIVEAALKIAQARLAVATIEQEAAVHLHRVPQGYFSQVKKEYQTRRDVLMKGLSKIPGVKFNQPQGAFYLIAELPVKNAEDFCKFMLRDFNYQDETVMVAPAEGFYGTPGLGRNQVRIAYVLNSRNVKKACGLLKMGLERYSLRQK